MEVVRDIMDTQELIRKYGKKLCPDDFPPDPEPEP
jgi:hypothetical protein